MASLAKQREGLEWERAEIEQVTPRIVFERCQLEQRAPLDINKCLVSGPVCP